MRQSMAIRDRLPRRKRDLQRAFTLTRDRNNRTHWKCKYVGCHSHFGHSSIVRVEPHSIAHLEVKNGWSDLKIKLKFDSSRVGALLWQLQLHQYREHKEAACWDRIYPPESLYPRGSHPQLARQLEPVIFIKNNLPNLKIVITYLIWFRNQRSWDVVVNLDVVRSSEGSDRGSTHWRISTRHRHRTRDKKKE